MAFVPRLLAVLPLTVTLACGEPASAVVWEEVYPLRDIRTFSVEGEGVTVRVTPPPPYPDDREVSDEEHAATYADAKIAVAFPGLAPFSVPKDEYRSSPYGIRVGIARLDARDTTPSVLLAGYSGGAHCCATAQVISLVEGRPVSTVLPMKDGEPLADFPEDIDGDGARDFEWIDSSLLYAFTSYAGSLPVPRIFNIRRGELIDVSREPGFAPRFRAFAAEALAECRAGGSENAGPCAAYAYAMAIQGKAEEGIRTAVRLAGEPSWYPYDCLVEEVDDRCPEGQERQFTGFEDALRWLMREHGYLPR
jgi:hypothetical protein